MTGSEALIHLRVPAELKARWVRESRAAGMRLTDWIVQRVEAQPMDKTVIEPSAEVRAEDAAGQACSHKPGRA